MINTSNSPQMKNPYLKNPLNQKGANAASNQITKKETIFDKIEESAVKVSLSMNAQIVLFSMDSSKLNNDNITAQSWIFDFLSGKQTNEGFSLEDIGYEGKPITELSIDEAKELVSEEGFFGINKTSDRVSNFVLEFANNDIEILKKGREGLVNGFEEAKKLWGDDLPDISYQTQNRTLSIIDEKIKELESATEATSS